MVRIMLNTHQEKAPADQPAAPGLSLQSIARNWTSCLRSSKQTPQRDLAVLHFSWGVLLSEDVRLVPEACYS